MQEHAELLLFFFVGYHEDGKKIKNKEDKTKKQYRVSISKCIFLFFLLKEKSI